MKTTSSQRWAFGAVALAGLIACSPPAHRVASRPQPPAAETPAVEVPPRSWPFRRPPAIRAGLFRRLGALTSADCVDTTEDHTMLSGEHAEPDAASAQLRREIAARKNIRPAARRSISITAACMVIRRPALLAGAGYASRSTFGASDTVMQMTGQR